MSSRNCGEIISAVYDNIKCSAAGWKCKNTLQNLLKPCLKLFQNLADYVKSCKNSQALTTYN